MLKILQPSLQQYVNQELPDVPAGFRKGRGTRDQIANICSVQLSSFQLFSHVRLLVTLWTAACQACLSITKSQSLLKHMSIKSVMPSNHFILCCPLLPPSIFPSIRVFSNVSVLCMRWPKYWSLSFSISSSNEYSGLISFRMNWLDHRKTREKKNLPWPTLKPLTVCVDYNKLWKILKEMGISDHLNCLLRNLYAGSEATI